MGRTKTSEAGSLVLGRKGAGGVGSRTEAKANLAAKSRYGFDGLSEAPWRKTPSIFKQPVTLVHTTSRETQRTPPEIEKRMASLPKVKDRVQSRQVFWGKSLEGLKAMVPLNLADRVRRSEHSCDNGGGERVGDDDDNKAEPEHIEQGLALAPKLEPIVGAISEEAATATLCASIQFPNAEAPITGQQSTKKQIDANPMTTINFAQPLAQIPLISEQDLLAQEKRVLDARKRLQELRKSFMIR